jgi:hypothetical protein
MLAVVRAIAKHRLVADRYTADPDAQQNILAASSVLLDWPKSFFVLLKDIGQQASTGEYGRVGKQHLSIYRALFRNRAIGSTQCTDFLRVAFLDFALDYHEHGSARGGSSDSLSPECQRFLTDAEFGARAELHQKTATRLLKTFRPTSKSIAKSPRNVSFANKKGTDIYRRRRDPGMILDMVRHGSKLGRVNLVDLHIADGAGPLFHRKYIPLSTIADVDQRSTIELMRRCAERNVRVLLLPITKQGLQPIIPATDQGRLAACVTKD